LNWHRKNIKKINTMKIDRHLMVWDKFIIINEELNFY
jgi:hypothetical protein